MIVFHSCLLAASLLLLYPASTWLVDGLVRLARFLNWREFVVSFFLVALAASLPNLIVGLASVGQGVTQLSFGDISGNNIVAITLAVALAVFASTGGRLKTGSHVIQTTALFTALAALLPVWLVNDNQLSRGDGLILICLFLIYGVWLFSKKENFEREPSVVKSSHRLKFVFQNFGKIFFGLIILVVAGHLIVSSASYFAQFFGVPIIQIGFLVTGLGGALPEVYFAAISARRGENWIILGNLMGAVILPSTLVLGLVAILQPIYLAHLGALASVRLWLVIPAVLFVWYVRSGREITRFEAAILLIPYLLFVASQFFAF